MIFRKLTLRGILENLTRTGPRTGITLGEDRIKHSGAQQVSPTASDSNDSGQFMASWHASTISTVNTATGAAQRFDTSAEYLIQRTGNDANRNCHFDDAQHDPSSPASASNSVELLPGVPATETFDSCPGIAMASTNCKKRFRVGEYPATEEAIPPKKRQLAKPRSSVSELTRVLDGAMQGPYRLLGMAASITRFSVISRVSSRFSRRTTAECVTVSRVSSRPSPGPSRRSTGFLQSRLDLSAQPASNPPIHVKRRKPEPAIEQAYARYLYSPPFISRVDRTPYELRSIDEVHPVTYADNPAYQLITPPRTTSNAHENDKHVAKLLRTAIDRRHTEDRADFVNKCDQKGITALHLAVAYGCREACGVLLDSGANHNARTAKGWSISRFAKFASRHTGDEASDFPFYHDILSCIEFVRHGRAPKTRCFQGGRARSTRQGRASVTRRPLQAQCCENDGQRVLQSMPFRTSGSMEQGTTGAFVNSGNLTSPTAHYGAAATASLPSNFNTGFDTSTAVTDVRDWAASLPNPTHGGTDITISAPQDRLLPPGSNCRSEATPSMVSSQGTSASEYSAISTGPHATCCLPNFQPSTVSLSEEIFDHLPTAYCGDSGTDVYAAGQFQDSGPLHLYPPLHGPYQYADSSTLEFSQAGSESQPDLWTRAIKHPSTEPAVSPCTWQSPSLGPSAAPEDTVDVTMPGPTAFHHTFNDGVVPSMPLPGNNFANPSTPRPYYEECCHGYPRMME
jgi:hypothetical protein